MKEKIIVKLENVSKKFNKVSVINNLNLDVYDGEFLTLLGPSGCGKTTILRLISGLETVTEGKIFIDDEDVTKLDPTKRETNTIFQNFALFPHLTTYENIAFGLRVKKLKKDEIDKEVKKVIKLVNLDGLEDRLPAELSGGQQQRVAIARGIVMHPKVLLLDEALCSLDLKLKKKMQIELKKLQKKLGITFIYVTHDQDEALSMSKRIAIINKCKIEQIDTPENIYKHPKTTFVADFIGESNIFKGIFKTDNKLFIDKLNLKFNIKGKKSEKETIIIRPEDIMLSANKKENFTEGIVNDYVYSGESYKYEIKLEDTIIKANSTLKFAPGERIYLGIEDTDLIIIGEKNEEE